MLLTEPAPWHDWIAPRTIVELARNTAPFLFDKRTSTNSPFLDLLNRDSEPETLAEYFSLCVAAHHATVATFVPTDVDTKIRGLIWRRTRDREVVRAMSDFALGWADWDLRAVSRRYSGAGHRLCDSVSGHNGEWLSVVAGALGRFLLLEDAEYAEKMAEAIDAELVREAAEFMAAFSRPGAEITFPRKAHCLTQNRLTQHRLSQHCLI